MLKILQYISIIIGGIAAIWKLAIERRKELWESYKNWKKGHNEDKVDKAIAGRDGGRMGKLMRNILKKRYKRHKTS